MALLDAGYFKDTVCNICSYLESTVHIWFIGYFNTMYDSKKYILLFSYFKTREEIHELHTKITFFKK